MPDNSQPVGGSAHEAATATTGATPTDNLQTPDAKLANAAASQVREDYANEVVRDALHALLDAPDYEHLAAFLNTLREGYLVVDVTGMPSKSKKRGARVRTIRSTRGQLVLPVFTSMDELRTVRQPTGPNEQFSGAVMPAREALSLIGTDRFVAAEFDKGGRSLIVLRKYLMLVLGRDDTITPEDLEALGS